MTNTMNLQAISNVLASPVTTNLVSSRMTFTIGDVFEATNAAYLTQSTCAACGHRFVELAPIDAGADYHAFCLPTCSICVEAIGVMLDFEMTVEQMELVWDAHEGNMGEEFFEDEDAYDDFLGRGMDEQHVDLDSEKWDNYFGDYNQCGIYVTY